MDRKWFLAPSRALRFQSGQQLYAARIVWEGTDVSISTSGVIYSPDEQFLRKIVAEHNRIVDIDANTALAGRGGIPD